LLAVGFKNFGSEEELQKTAIMHLFNVYVATNAAAEKERSAGGDQVINSEAREFFRRMEDGNASLVSCYFVC